VSGEDDDNRIYRSDQVAEYGQVAGAQGSVEGDLIFPLGKCGCVWWSRVYVTAASCTNR
jgi:hypothetical protein